MVRVCAHMCACVLGTEGRIENRRDQCLFRPSVVTGTDSQFCDPDKRMQVCTQFHTYYLGISIASSIGRCLAVCKELFACVISLNYLNSQKVVSPSFYCQRNRLKKSGLTAFHNNRDPLYFLSLSLCSLC